jgi:hypothetical protein
MEGNGSDLISVTLLSFVSMIEKEREREKPGYEAGTQPSRPRYLEVHLMKNLTVFIHHISDPSTFMCLCALVCVLQSNVTTSTARSNGEPSHLIFTREILHPYSTRRMKKGKLQKKKVEY